MPLSSGKRHALIVGEPGVGKSTLIGRVRAALECREDGLETRKWAELGDEVNGIPVYLRRVGRPFITDAAHCVGCVSASGRRSFPETFDAFAEEAMGSFGQAQLIILDELGFLESEAEIFRSSVLKLLDGEIPVLAAVKTKSTAFLNAVREHPAAECFELYPDNRDAQLERVLDYMRDRIS